MGVSVYVSAIVEVTPETMEKVKLYNSLVEEGYDAPDKLKADLLRALGDEVAGGVCYGGRVELNDDGVEVNVSGEGDIEYGDGMLIDLSLDLPPDTRKLRVYMEG
jgi:hypothetical protein